MLFDVHALLCLALLAGMTVTARAAPTRAEFAAKLAQVKPGMTVGDVERIVGKPDDIKTERDPGGITAARTVEIWRYGTHAHLAFATLGAIHLQADHKVQYVFGGSGTPSQAVPEPELRRLLELLDAVPSYNQVLEPLRLVQAVDALVPLGKATALAVVREYLRVSSDLDDPGREGVFLVMRALFEVPAGGMPPMMVGAAAQPKDPKALPRFPLAIVDDVPLKLVGGYALGGMAERPEDDVAAFDKVGTMRTTVLAPSPQALDKIDAYVAKLGAAFAVDDQVKIMIYDQALRLFGTVYRPAKRTIDSWFPYGDAKLIATTWAGNRGAIGKLGVRWDAKTTQFVLADGSTLPALPGGFPRVWWDLALAGATTARLTLERKSDQLVALELRFELAAGASIKADAIAIVDPTTGKTLGTLAIAALAAPAGSSTGSVSGSRLELARGHAVRLQLASGVRGPTLVP